MLKKEGKDADLLEIKFQCNYLSHVSGCQLLELICLVGDRRKTQVFYVTFTLRTHGSWCDPQLVAWAHLGAC